MFLKGVYFSRAPNLGKLTVYAEMALNSVNSFLTLLGVCLLPRVSYLIILSISIRWSKTTVLVSNFASVSPSPKI